MPPLRCGVPMRIDLQAWRIPLIILGAFIVLQAAALWLLADARSEAQTARQQLTWVKRQQDVVSWMNHKPDSAALAQPLAQAVAEGARRAGVTLPPLVSQGDTVQMSFSAIGFNTLLGWLQQMQQTSGVVVVALDLAPAASGEVSVSRLVLGRPPRAQ